jgi:N-acetylglucosaminyldiphosphoundecaprenol N-acetyl-beta-D-mannosaminyltransferase
MTLANPDECQSPDAAARHPTSPSRHLLPVLGVPIDAITPAQAVLRIAAWAQHHESRVVCMCNAHSVVTATQDPDFMAVLRKADMATPDGAPVAWMLRRQGVPGQQRVSGPDLMPEYLQHSAATGESVFLYGSTPATLQRLQAVLHRRWPALKIAGALSPPFRLLTEAEDKAIVDQINASGAGTVWVSLGCPKQERWMAEHQGRVQAVMVGVGAGFDFHAGMVPRAPAWMQSHGLEWLHRLFSEPARLGRRYITTNSAFLLGAMRQLLRP